MYEIHRRAQEFLAVLVPELEKRGVEKVIVFSHAATCIALSRALAGDLENLSEDVEGRQWDETARLECRAATCSVSKFERKEDSPAQPEWTRVWNGKTDFLQGGEERHWEFSYVEVSEPFHPFLRCVIPKSEPRRTPSLRRRLEARLLIN